MSVSHLDLLMSFGIWPALPITGHLFFKKKINKDFTHSGTFAVFSFASAAGIAVWSVPLFISVLGGIYRAAYFGLLGWIISLCFFFSLSIRPRIFLRRISFDRWDILLAIGLFSAASFYLGFPTESILGGTDQGIYADQGIYIADHGRMDIPYPPGFEPFKKMISADNRHNKSIIPGLYFAASAMKMQFSSLFSVWLAEAYSIFGHYGLFRLNAVFSLLFLGIFYGFCRFLIPKSYAVLATIFMSLNPGEIWMARITLSEILARLLIWGSLFALAYAVKNSDRTLARWAGLFIGVSILVRIDSLFMIPIIFLSHVGQRIFEGPSSVKHSSVWTALYQSALPVSAVTGFYYATYNSSYLRGLFRVLPELTRVGIAGSISIFIVILLAVNKNSMNRIRTFLSSKPGFFTICALVIALAIYAYWLRPNIGPYSMVSNPLHYLYGTRDFRENSLVNLSKYISPFAIWGGVVGFLIILREIMIKRKNIYLLPVFLFFIFVSLLYLWNPFLAINHFWAVRRFVTVIIPGFIMFTFIFMSRALDKIPRSWSNVLLVPFVAYLFIFIARADRLIFTFSEDNGLYEQMKQIAEKLPPNQVVLAYETNESAAWLVPLYTAFDRRVIPINLDIAAGKRFFYNWISEHDNEKDPAYFLYEGGMNLKGREITKTSMVLSRSYIEPTKKPLPQKISTFNIIINLYKITCPCENTL